MDTVNYTYGNANWGDLLTKYDGQTITYDTIGNPLNYYNGSSWGFTWEHGRELTGISGGGYNWSLYYDANGMRTKRETSSTTTANTYRYYYNGSSLSRMTKGTDVLDFVYGADSAPVAVVYNNVYYYYVTNLQGDVVALLDSDGDIVVSYAYDAWGKPISTTGSMASTLGALNPLRYRGYVYDTETGFYYLQSRYYDPTIGRFLNADAQLNPQDGLLGFNMFAYCGNNPINYSDPDGHSIILACVIIGAVFGAVAGGCVGGYISYNQTGEVNGWAVVAGAVTGGMVGGLLGWGIGAAIATAGVTGGGSAVGTIAQASHEIYKNWQAAEEGLRKSIGSVVDYSQRVFYTLKGSRVVDAFNASKRIIAEAKYGYQSLSTFIRSEIERDALLLQTGAVSEVQWHFYYSEISHTIGGSYQLIRALLDAGIQVFYHQ